jgi:predicted RNA binding protein YcfA (HicA-like mRNA interferase family)
VGVHVRTKGSHRRYRVIANGVTASTSVQQHSGDIPKGTLAAIERDLEPALGKKWLQ